MPASSVTVDFGDTESRGGKKSAGRVHVPPGDYAVKCVKAEITKSSEKETPGIAVIYRITEGKNKGTQVRDNLWLTPKSLWRVRQTLEAMGLQVPSKRVKVEPSKLVGKACAITVDDEEYEGKLYSRVVDTFLISEFESIREDSDEEGFEDEEEEVEEGDEEESSEDEDLEDIDLDSI